MEKNVGKISGISTIVNLVGKISGISTDPTYTLVHVYNSRDSTNFYKKNMLSYSIATNFPKLPVPTFNRWEILEN